MGRLNKGNDELWIGKVSIDSLENAAKFRAWSRFLMVIGRPKEANMAHRWSFRTLKQGTTPNSVMVGKNVSRLRRSGKRPELN
jgi:hypothetical protein